MASVDQYDTTFFIFGLLEEVNVQPEYETGCQADWIVHTRLS